MDQNEVTIHFSKDEPMTTQRLMEALVKFPPEEEIVRTGCSIGGKIRNMVIRHPQGDVLTIHPNARFGRAPLRRIHSAFIERDKLNASRASADDRLPWFGHVDGPGEGDETQGGRGV